MDEAEALSTKIGIMAKGGQLKCFGSAQHIKNKFSTGYIIEIKTKQPLWMEIVDRASGYGAQVLEI
jgi:ABC-type multidrug transport system ATPase subunit